MSTANQVIVSDSKPNQIIINEDTPNQVIIRTVSVSSGPTVRHTHTQGQASSTWVINHTLGGKPQVTIVDSADTVVVGEVTYNSNSVVEVNFTSAFSGFAYLT